MTQLNCIINTELVLKLVYLNYQSVLKGWEIMNSKERVLDILIRLQNGEVLNYRELEEQYHIDSRTRRENVREIDNILVESDYEVGRLKRNKSTIKLVRTDNEVTDNFDIALALGHLVLGSRAFTSKEADNALQFLKNGFAEPQQQTLTTNLEPAQHAYKSIANASELYEKIGAISAAILAHKKVGCKLIPETTFKRAYNE